MTSRSQVRSSRDATTPKLDSVLDDLPLYLPRIYYALLGLLERRLEKLGLAKHLRPGMGHVLLKLYEKDDCIIKEIATGVQLASGTLTGLLKRMEKAGLVDCRRCPDDGRAVRVRLTPRGWSLQPKVEAFHESIVETIQADLSEREIKTAKKLLGKIFAAIRNDDH